MTLGYEILVKVICTLVALGAVITQTQKASYDSPKNKAMLILERLAASFMYGVAITFLAFSLGGNWEINGFVAVILLISSTAAAYIADIRLQGKDIFGLNEKEEIVMPK